MSDPTEEVGNGNGNGEGAERKTALLRSPPVPKTSLERMALEFAFKLYEEDGRNVMTAAAMCAHWGKSPGSGTSGNLLSSAREYGLTSKRGIGRFILTDDALDLIEAKMTSVWGTKAVEIVERLIFSPTVFAKIREEYPDGVSVASLGIFLAKQGYSKKALQADIISTYQENLEWAGRLRRALDEEATVDQDDDILTSSPEYFPVSAQPVENVAALISSSVVPSTTTGGDNSLGTASASPGALSRLPAGFGIPIPVESDWLKVPLSDGGCIRLILSGVTPETLPPDVRARAKELFLAGFESI